MRAIGELGTPAGRWPQRGRPRRAQARLRRRRGRRPESAREGRAGGSLAHV